MVLHLHPYHLHPVHDFVPTTAPPVYCGANGNSSKTSSAVLSPLSFRSSLSGPFGGPREKSKGEKGCKMTMHANSFTRDNTTYPEIWQAIDALLVASWEPQKAASSVAPWIICAVDPTSGTNIQPVRRASMPVYLFTFHERVFLVTGYTPTSN